MLLLLLVVDSVLLLLVVPVERINAVLLSKEKVSSEYFENDWTMATTCSA